MEFSQFAMLVIVVCVAMMLFVSPVEPHLRRSDLDDKTLQVKKRVERLQKMTVSVPERSTARENFVFPADASKNRNMKSLRLPKRQNVSRRTRKLSIVCLASLLVLGGFVSSLAARQTAGNQAAPVILEAAKAKYKEAREAYSIARRLSAQDSVSQSRLRRARLARDLATLEVSSLSDPAVKSYNKLLKAQLVYRFRKEEWDIARRLYQKRLTSELAWRRAEAAKDVAKLELQALRSSSQVQRQLKQIAAVGFRLEVAREEYETAKRLFATGSISEAEFREVGRRLGQVQEAHRDSKRSFGVLAIPFRN